MKNNLTKLSSFEYLIFIIIATAILGSFMISQIKVSVIKSRVLPASYKGEGGSEKKDKKSVVLKWEHLLTSSHNLS
ncbi:MAG: hypothetical protein SP4CHLAM5_06100 [Chlamydiia bacterium]|nr:hypothetical protein [Chlamydiia bacterium]MCH9618479.1 hypothetical protein [Chlamydiia bacterium]MCH9623768.1 hypothetical protein [Chlamydiia bacterium]